MYIIKKKILPRIRKKKIKGDVYLDKKEQSNDNPKTEEKNNNLIKEKRKKKNNESIKKMLYTLGDFITSLNDEKHKKEIYIKLETMKDEIVEIEQDLTEKYTKSLNDTLNTMRYTTYFKSDTLLCTQLICNVHII